MSLIDLTRDVRTQPKGTNKKRELEQQFPVPPPSTPPMYAYGTDGYSSSNYWLDPWNDWAAQDEAFFQLNSPAPTFSDIVPPNYQSPNVIDQRGLPMEPPAALAAGANFFVAPAGAETDQNGNWWDSSVQAWRDPKTGQLWNGSGWGSFAPTPEPPGIDEAYFQTQPNPRVSPDTGWLDDRAYFQYTAPPANPQDAAQRFLYDPPKINPENIDAGGSGWLNPVGSKISDLLSLAKTGWDIKQGTNPSMGTFTAKSDNGVFNQQDIAKTGLATTFSGEKTLEALGIDSSGLPDDWYFPVRQAVDTVAAPATILTAGAGSSVPIIGSAFGGRFATRLAGETALGTAGLLGSEAGGNIASQYTDNPYIIGGASVAGGLIGGAGAFGGIKGAQRPISEVLSGTPAYLRDVAESGARMNTPRLSIEEQMIRGAVDPATGRPLGFGSILGGAEEGLTQGDDLLETAAARDFLRFSDQERELRNKGIVQSEIRTGRGEALGTLQERAAQAQEMGLTGKEANDFIRGGMGTGILQKTFAEPIPPEQFPILNDIVRKALVNNEITEPQFLTAINGLRRAELENRLQPAENDILRRILGDDVTERLSVPYSGKIKVEDAGVGQAPTKPLPGFEELAVRGDTGLREAPTTQGVRPMLEEDASGNLIPNRIPRSMDDPDARAAYLERERARTEAINKALDAKDAESLERMRRAGDTGAQATLRFDEEQALIGNPKPTTLTAEEKQWLASSVDARTQKWVEEQKAKEYADIAMRMDERARAADASARIAAGQPALKFEDEALYGARPVLPTNPLDPFGPAVPVNTLKTRDEAMDAFRQADLKASDAERRAIGTSKTDWMGDKASRRGRNPDGSIKQLSPKGVKKQDKEWAKMLGNATDQGAATEAMNLRKEADSILARLKEMEGKLDFMPGEGNRGGQGIDLLPTVDISPEGDLILRPQLAADVDLGVAPSKPRTMVRGYLGSAETAEDVAASGAELATKRQKAGKAVLEALNLPRAIKAGGELSGAARQGAVLAPSHPVAYKKAMAAQLRAYFKQDSFDKIVADLRSRPLAGLRRKAGLFQANEAGNNLNAREEAFILSFTEGLLPESVQKFNVFKKGERGYIAMLDTLRAEVFDSTVERWMKQGYAPTDKELTRLAEFINHATGRGTGTAFDRAGSIASTILFAPRYIASKPQMLWDLVIAPPAVRKEVAKGVGAWLGTIVGLGALSEGARQAGIWDGEVDIGPLSGGFGKVKIGNYGLDLTSGFAGEIRTLARYGNAAINAAQGEKQTNSPLEVAQRWGRGKLSPNAALVLDLHLGEDYTGNKVNFDTLDGARRAAFNTFGNLFAQDLYNIAKEEFGDGDFTPTDVLRAAAFATLAFFGINSGLRDKSFQENKADAYGQWAKENGVTEASLDSASILDKARFEAENPQYYADEESRLGEIRLKAAERQDALEQAFVSGEGPRTLGQYNDTRKLNAAEIRGEYAQATKNLPDKDLADKVYQSYLDIFDEAVDAETGFMDGERFAQLEREWEKSNPKEYVDAIASLRNDGPVEAPRRAAINQLAADGFFPGEPNSIPRFLVKVSDASDKEILDLAAEVRGQAKNPAYAGLDYETRALVYLRKEGVPTKVILDVMEANKESNVHPKFEVYKERNKDLLIWLDSAATWEVIQANQR